VFLGALQEFKVTMKIVRGENTPVIVNEVNHVGDRLGKRHEEHGKVRLDARVDIRSVLFNGFSLARTGVSNLDHHTFIGGAHINRLCRIVARPGLDTSANAPLAE
jgi:hypothetical protein